MDLAFPLPLSETKRNRKRKRAIARGRDVVGSVLIPFHSRLVPMSPCAVAFLTLATCAGPRLGSLLLEQGYSISAAILFATRAADIFTDSRARWA